MKLRTKRSERTVAEYHQSVGMSDCENAGLPEVVLTPTDVPDADLSEAYEIHTVPGLRWWLLCRGIKVPNSWKKRKIIDR